MKVEQIYTKCLAQASYYIESEGEAAIIDPLREVGPYLEKANDNGAKIKYIFETHFHADFVSGHLTLSEKTDAPIIFGPEAKSSFKMHVAKDGEEFSLGKVTLKVLHTPGHTAESSCFLLRDERGKDYAIFSGDTLFLGDVGRPDLAQEAMHKTTEELAAILYDNLRNKIMPLADNVIVYPGHGAGSTCGKVMMKETVDTLGHQKKVNYALRADMSKEEFVKEVIEGLSSPPGYFPSSVKMNKEGYESIDTILEKGVTPLTPEAFEALADKTKALILDVRLPEDFAQAHIPKSLFVGLDGAFAPWVGAVVIDVRQPIILVVPEGRQEEAVIRLARIGFDNTLGYLSGGIPAWQAAGKVTERIDSISASAFLERYQTIKNAIFDVREKNDYLSEHIEGAKNTPLSNLNDFITTFPKNNSFYIHCGMGYRSMIAASLLKAKGIGNPIDMQKGLGAIKKTSIPIAN